ncbi:hypothetical protein QQF64_000370 [Cirrhinus molitorella]|uniref:Fibrinogen C-terminal domain-containing protein n=1 Tax=Cirrhinus molitorella TaxID=172907 RepID=A0ABR3NWZ8_9TELE
MALMVFLVALLPVVLGSDCKLMPFDCSDIYKSGQTFSGIYTIYPVGDDPVWVYCHMISDDKDENKGGWTVIQRRMDGSVNFYRPWNQYKRGFGNVEGEYWLGLENMYQLTRNRKYKLRVDMEDFTGRKVRCGSCTFSYQKALQWVKKTAQYINGVQLPSIKDIHHKRCLKCMRNTIKDSSHPSQRLFTLLPYKSNGQICVQTVL